MKTRITLAAVTAAVALLALAGCSAGGSNSPDSASPGSSSAGVASADLATADSSLGTIVVDGQGMTAYFFDKDTPGSGSSACTGDCAALWPAIESTSATPVVDGVEGEIGTITGVDGGHQITIDGRPIYTFANDKKPGDVAGQGVGGIWFAISRTGEELSSSSPAETTGSGTGY